MSGRFFTQINYSAANEDSSSELSALKLTNTDKVVCITGSGARPLDLLAADPQTIFSVDFNHAQNHLLNLKIAAFQSLEYDEFARFIGLNTAARPSCVFEKVLENLDSDSHAFWDQNQKLIERGLLYCGTWERLLCWISKGTVLRRRHVDGLLNASDLEAQKAYWQKHWSGFFFKTFLRVAFNRFLWTSIIREPGAKLIPKDLDAAAYLYRCIEKMAHHSLLRENPYANLLFHGRYKSGCQLPYHLQEENFSTIKSRVSSIKVVTAPLNEFLAKHPNQIDAFSLSDFSSYAPNDLYHSIWNNVVTSAKSNARFCERFFMVKMDELLKQTANRRQIEPWESRLSEDYNLMQALGDTDHTCIYSFRAGTILG